MPCFLFSPQHTSFQLLGCSFRNLSRAAVVIAGGERLPVSHCCKVGSLAGTPAEARARTASAWLRPFASRQALRRRMTGAGVRCDMDVSGCSETNLSSDRLRRGARSLPLLKCAEPYWQTAVHKRTDGLRLTEAVGRPPSFQLSVLVTGPSLVAGPARRIIGPRFACAAGHWGGARQALESLRLSA